MRDIVERLRNGIEWTGPTQDDTGQTENLMDEAADEIERLREWNREIALNAREFVAENEKLRAALRGSYEVYAGSDGFIPATAAEGYQQQIIKQMVDCISAALEGKP